MSYQQRARFGDVVVCDLCESFGAIFDREWRQMPHSTAAAPIHLCSTCRKTAAWCAVHWQYHLPDALHRRPCVDCGGLFTSIMRHGVEHCPACSRAVTRAPTGFAPARAPQRGRVAAYLTALLRQHSGDRRAPDKPIRPN